MAQEIVRYETYPFTNDAAMRPIGRYDRTDAHRFAKDSHFAVQTTCDKGESESPRKRF